MNVATLANPRTPAPRPRIDAVLELHYHVDHTGVRVRCDFPVPLDGPWLDIPFEVWKDWGRIRLRVRPDGVAPRTVLLLADLQGNPLSSGRNGPVRRVGALEVDLLPTRATGLALGIVLAGPGNITTVRVFLGLANHDAASGMAELGLMPPAPRVLEVL